MWPSNVKENTKTHTLIYLIHTHAYTHTYIHAHAHTHTHTRARTHTYTHAHTHTHTHTSFTLTHKHFLQKKLKSNQNNLDSDRQSFIYMNIQDIYNTQLVQKEKEIYTHVQDI